MKFATKYPDVIPRMVAWEMSKRLAPDAIDIVLKSKELEVNSTLIPTEAELKEVYWKELTPIVEEDESVLHHSEGDKTEHDVEPHHAYHEESPRATQSLQHVELVVASRFHPATSAFDGSTSSIAYVPEYEPKGGLEKEARFYDVTDVPANERKVDLHEDDPKLKKDVREKNVGGKELETEPGFDDVRNVPAAKTNVEAYEEDPKLEEEVRGKNVGENGLEKEAGSENHIDEQENEKNGQEKC
ncbi:Hypothetical predicted protein [Olea europaea subsp. europaea]|uniref:Uncharacterized protein n=1 Tax=Olea europaea subsp. europaea TaxID=158383 RepID=A0A8S0TU12_OLEEU|nr:Hypothetical predicted protein [Olea europaea subsp. europaea]